jgi:hypothetical protein
MNDKSPLMFTPKDVIEMIIEIDDMKRRSQKKKSVNTEPTVAAVSVEPAPSAKEDYSYLEDRDKWDEFGYPKRRPRVREPSEEEAAELLKMKYYIPEEYPAEKKLILLFKCLPYCTFLIPTAREIFQRNVHT